MKKVAIPVTKSNNVDDHFGHCEFYGVYTISDNNEIVDVETPDMVWLAPVNVALVENVPPSKLTLATFVPKVWLAKYVPLT